MSKAMRPAWIAAAAMAGLLAPFAGAQQSGPDVPAQRQAELRALVLQDCGSCHGMRLTGGLGPALTARALRDRPVESLVATVVHGRPGTAMPPWKGLLTQAEAVWIVERLVEGDFGGER